MLWWARRRSAVVPVAAVGAEVDDDQRHRVAHPRQPAVGVLAAHRGRQQALVGAGDVGVADDDHRPAARARRPAGRPSRAGLDGQDLARPRRPSSSAPPSSSKRRTSAVDDRAGAAHREPDAPLPLQVVDQRVDAGRLERVAADQQRVEREDLAQPLVLHEARDEAVDRAVALAAGPGPARS